MRILIIGKNGQLGKSLQKQVTEIKSNHNFTFVGRDELDLSFQDNIASYFEEKVFDIVINCAAYTSVDKAEKEPELANQINHLAVAQLAVISKVKHFKLIHISTDYIFDGKNNKPYKETDSNNPINTYGKTKLAGENAIQDLMTTNAIIIRTSWVYSEYNNNFVSTMLKNVTKQKRLNIISDQLGSPTYATDLANVILKIINSQYYLSDNNKTEIYHFSNLGTTSWYEFAKEIFKIKKISCIVHPMTTSEYKTLADRPKNTVMDKDKIKQKFDVNLIAWKDSLKKCLTS